MILEIQVSLERSCRNADCSSISPPLRSLIKRRSAARSLEPRRFQNIRSQESGSIFKAAYFCAERPIGHRRVAARASGDRRRRRIVNGAAIRHADRPTGRERERKILSPLPSRKHLENARAGLTQRPCDAIAALASRFQARELLPDAIVADYARDYSRAA